uniref:Cytochrome c oxidase subunit 2 n=1 Tax=Monomachus antipodalis TaxID=161211 RepID=A0A0E3I853_9HYME|nr:cytochrome c oxidase subunit II [Monomachus antipodalis]
MSMWTNIMFQNAASPIMENMVMFHDYSMLILMIIFSFIIYMMFKLIENNIINRFMLSGQMLEIIWTLIPFMFLFYISFPSLKILYLLDCDNKSLLSMKIMGHQWYWSYEYSDFLNLEFDSFMVYMKMGEMNLFRLMDVDNRLIVPMNIQVRLLISSLDVIHSFTIPSMGFKIDAIPGRVNQVNMYINRPGIYYGQCSEICGMNHSFMPIVMESVSLKYFLNWLKMFK